MRFKFWVATSWLMTTLALPAHASIHPPSRSLAPAHAAENATTCTASDYAQHSADDRKAHAASPLVDDGSVYQVGDRRWDQMAEDDYAKWVRANIDSHFMEKYQISTDCAKASAVIRAIYARINNLPTLFTNRRSSVGHFSKTWANLPTIHDWSQDRWQSALQSDRRFRAYLDGVMGNISTSTIIYNTYPVRLSDETHPERLSKYVHEGIPLVDATHVRFISAVESGTFLPVQELASDLPVQVRQLNGGPFSLFDYPVELGRGVVSWRWVVNCAGTWSQVPATAMPGFSMQQYELPTEPSLSEAEQRLNTLHAEMNQLEIQRAQLAAHKKSFVPADQFNFDTIVAKLSEDKKQTLLTERTINLYHKNPNLQYYGTLASLVHRLAGQRAPMGQDIQNNVDVLQSKIMDRVTIVNEAQAKLRENAKVFNDPASSACDDYSTPERDKQAFLLWRNLLSTMKGFDTPQRSLSTQVKTALSSRNIDLGNGQKINLERFMEAIPAGKVSTSPGDTLAKRWGFEYQTLVTSP